MAIVHYLDVIIGIALRSADMMKSRKVLLTTCLYLTVSVAFAQYIDGRTNANVAVPFLLLSAEAGPSGRGEAGSALLTNMPDIESNTAKTALAAQRFNISTTYTPWLRRLVSDRKLVYFGTFFKPSQHLALSASINYLSYGMIDLADENNVSLNSVRPAEFYISLGIARKFAPNFSMGMKFKLINSNMYNGMSNSPTMQSGNSYGIDLSLLQVFPMNAGHDGSSFSLALNIANIGPKISYFNQIDQKFYLPTSLKIGSALRLENENNNTFSVAFDVSKLLVPSTHPNDGQSVMESIGASFKGNEAFGNIGISLGTEYNLNKKLSFRMGYNHQKSDQLIGSFVSLGTGLAHKNITVNFSYLIAPPTRSFLSNTLRISLGYSLF
jgi:Type IX secretion system protein PorV